MNYATVSSAHKNKFAQKQQVIYFICSTNKQNG